MTVLVSCGSNARIEGTVSDAASSEVVVKLLNSNRYEILDTVKTNAAGQFTYKVNVAEGQPEFVYLFHNDRKVATLLLEAGDKVAVTADALGNAVIEGSEESVKLAEVEKKYADALKEFEALAEFVNEIEFDRLGCFSYSPQEGTPAFDFENQVDEETKLRRGEIIMGDQLEIVNLKNHEKIGNTYRVLVEDYDGYSDSYSGRTYMDAPDIDGKIVFTTDKTYNNGEFTYVEVIGMNDYDLIGKDVS